MLAKINLRKGLFRIWIVTTIVWVGFCAIVGAESFLKYRDYSAKLQQHCSPNLQLPPGTPQPPLGFCEVTDEVESLFSRQSGALIRIEQSLLAIIAPFLALALIEGAVKVIRWIVAGFRK